eukprot:6653407-Pyramimonas_sp.AAC.1
MQEIAKASNIRAPRYVYEWKFVKDETGDMERTIRLRVVLRGFMELEVSDVETCSGTARRLRQKELAGVTGEKERVACFTLPPGSATVLRTLPRFENYDESKHCLQCLKPGTGAKGAPRAFSLQLRRTTRGFGLRPTSYDEEFEASSNLLTATHVDDINMAGTEDTIDKYAKCVEDTFGKCRPNKHTCAKCDVIYTTDEGVNVALDQDESITQLRPIQHPELTGADADGQATKMMADMVVSLRGALACALITQIWLMAYVVSLQRVQDSTNFQVRRLNAITRKLQACPKKI